MNAFVPIALYGWVAVVLAMFSSFTPRRAVLASFIGAWLFLPEAGIPISGLPDLTKVTVTSFAVFAGVLVFDASRLMRFRVHWIDLPMIVWCIVPVFSSVTNGLGVYDGMSEMLNQIAKWGLPYFIGRLYFTDLAALRELAIAVLIGGLIYVPLCLIEIRLSPQLHRWVYGAHPNQFAQTIRFGGYRPTVFMAHGLMVSLWMVSATLVAVWMWWSGALKKLFQVPISVISLVLVGTTILCKSAGAIALMFVGFGTMFALRYIKVGWIVLALVLLPPAYIFLRANDLWRAQEFVTLAESVDVERAKSLEGRIRNETMLVGKALDKPAFGWGTWGRWRVRDEYGKDITTADSLWIISLGQTGLVGLTSILFIFLLPSLLLLKRIPARNWLHPAAAPAAALCVLLALYMMDSLLNAMLNPVFVLAAGGIGSFYLAAPGLRAQAARMMQQFHAERQARLARQLASKGESSFADARSA